MSDDSLPAWMTHGRTVLCQKDPRKSNAVENYQLITFLPLMFFLSMVHLLLILREVNANYECGNKEYKLNHLLLMDDLKLFSKSEEQMHTLVRTVHVFSTDIEMESGMKKCGTLTMKRGKAVRCE